MILVSGVEKFSNQNEEPGIVFHKIILYITLFAYISYFYYSIIISIEKDH
jgi:hypothetical protein